MKAMRLARSLPCNGYEVRRVGIAQKKKDVQKFTLKKNYVENFLYLHHTSLPLEIRNALHMVLHMANVTISWPTAL
jgi:hypothetical protein